jgi:hypothetical protein
MQSGTLVVLLGAALILGGILFWAGQGIWRGRFSRTNRQFPARGLGFRSNWPSLALIAIGAILLLAQAAFYNPG